MLFSSLPAHFAEEKQSRLLRRDHAVLFADVAGPGRLLQIHQLAVEVSGCRVGELDVHNPGRAEGAADDVLRQTVHLHVAGATFERRSEPGPKMHNVTYADHAG